MAETLENIPNKSQQQDYATCLQELEQGLPIFGRVTGTTDDLKQVDKELPFNFRQPFNVVKAIFKLQPGLYTLHTGIDHEIQIGFRIDQPISELSDSGEPTKKPLAKSNASDSANDYYRNRALRLEGELHDGDRKIRQLVDEIMNLKRELSEDKTATLLTHQKELSELKETHRNEIDRLKEAHRGELKAFEKQISELEKVKFRMEMEQRAGGRDAGSRMLDMLEENAPMFFTVISQMFAGQGQQQIATSLGQDQSTNGFDISEEQAKSLADSLKNEMSTHGHRPSQPNAHLTNQASQPKGDGDRPPHHLPSDLDGQTELTGGEDDQTLNGLFAPEQRNGHGEHTISL